MLRRVVIGASLACLLSGAAYAVDEAVEPAEGEDQCTQQLAAAEEAVQNKIDAQTLSEEDTEKVNELLDQADAQCTEGNLAEATATLATVNKMVGKYVWDARGGVVPRRPEAPGDRPEPPFLDLLGFHAKSG